MKYGKNTRIAKRWERIKILELYSNLVKIVRSWKRCCNKETLPICGRNPEYWKKLKKKKTKMKNTNLWKKLKKKKTKMKITNLWNLLKNGKIQIMENVKKWKNAK